MAERAEKTTAILLVRHGERETNHPGSGLKKDDKGTSFITDVVRADLENFPFAGALYAPTPVCRETLRLIFKGAKKLLFTGKEYLITETDAIYFPEQDLTHKWSPLVNELGGEIKTVADLKAAEERCLKSGSIREPFLLAEGERIFNHAVAATAGFYHEGTLLVVTHSPLPETVMLWLWKTQANPYARTEKTLADLPALSFMDGYLLILRDGKFEKVVLRNYEELVRRFRQKEAAGESLRNLPLPKR